ncbi:hypothetical protein CFK37_04480 [Virgibacillus phasianinus]|uniref:Uncharacterized protein n=1 Tax=Virgibacillus phasianinus TaxID=2017483 RepID=A0A220U0X7_9BACI|nr:hypothetical protein [Virgibacillus phasianinus]ASK61481.1 hypothetical protein CFK37_04480 [Virgibacillus phasianinus]
MKTILYLVLTIMVVVAVSLNNDGENNTAQQGNELSSNHSSVEVMSSETPSLMNGLNQVLASLNELKSVVMKATENKKKLKGIAEKVGENWDKIEKQVEEKYPDDYENIEKSLYPLLAEAKKEQPNLANIGQLLKDSTKKLEAFKKKVANNPS